MKENKEEEGKSMRTEKQEIRKRKRSFRLFCLAVVLLMQGVMPSLTALAADHNVDDTTTYAAGNIDPYSYTGSVEYMVGGVGGDAIKFYATVSPIAGDSPEIKYYDQDGTTPLGTDTVTVTESDDYTVYVEDYRDSSGALTLTSGTRQIPEGTPVIWKITNLYRSGGAFKSISLQAVAATEYSITYNVNSAEGENPFVNPDKYYEGVGATILDATANLGYEFKGWYETDESVATLGYTIPASAIGNKTLTAKFTPKHYNISYVLDGGSDASGNPSGYTYGTGVTSFAAPTREGHTFEGWYASATDTTPITSISATNMGNVTLYARWRASDYAITYDLNGGSNAPGNPSGYTYGTGVASFAAPTREGHTFEGWYTSAAYEPYTQITAISATHTGNVTLWARWRANDYAITYNLNGGSNALGNPSGYVYGAGVTSFAAPTREGYTFEGWYASATDTTPITFISAANTGNVTLYARWRANDYAITYNLNGGSNALGNPSGYVYGAGVTSFAAPTREGYTFEGWYASATDTTPITSISATHTGNVTLWAKWVEAVSGEDEDEDDDEDESLPEETLQPPVKDAVPDTGEDAAAALPAAACVTAAAALALLMQDRRRSRRH